MGDPIPITISQAVRNGGEINLLLVLKILKKAYKRFARIKL